MVAWVTGQCGVSTSTARQWVRSAANLESLPCLAEGLASGELSLDLVEPLAEVASAETDAALREASAHWSVRQAGELVAWHRAQSEEADEARAAEAVAAGVDMSGSAVREFQHRTLRFNDTRRTIWVAFTKDDYATAKSALVGWVSADKRDRARHRVGPSATPYIRRGVGRHRSNGHLSGRLAEWQQGPSPLTNGKLVVLCSSFGAQACPLRHSSPISGTLRALLYDAAGSRGNFIATASLLDPFRRQVGYNNQVLFSFLEHVVYSAGFQSVSALRVLPVTCAALTVGVLAGMTARWFGYLSSTVAVAVLALNPEFATQGRDVRGYSLIALMGLLSTLCLVRWLRGAPRWIPYAYVATLVVAIGTNLFALGIVVVQVAVLLAA